MTALETVRVSSFDGTSIAAHVGGAGPMVVLSHGFLADSARNWVMPGIAAALIDAGRRVVAVDHRGHGESARPTDPAAWPSDVLARDLAAAVAALVEGEFDLVGYSLGARTAVRAMIGGLRPRRAVLGGMGDTGLIDAGARAAQFRAAIEDRAGSTPYHRAVQIMIDMGGLDPACLLLLLAAFVPTSPAMLATVAAPCLVVAGVDDADNGSAEALAALLPRARALRVPGDHLTAIPTEEMRAAIVEFVTKEDVLF